MVTPFTPYCKPTADCMWQLRVRTAFKPSLNRKTTGTMGAPVKRDLLVPVEDLGG